MSDLNANATLYVIFDQLLTQKEKSELKRAWSVAKANLPDESTFIQGKVAMGLLSDKIRASITTKLKQAKEEVNAGAV